MPDGSSPPTRTPPPDPGLLEHAMLLVARIERGEPGTAAAATAELDEWSRRSEAHADAASFARRIWQATQGDTLRDRIARPRSATERRTRRRRATGLLATGGLLLAGGLTGRWIWQRPLHELTLETGHARLLTQPLPDGSRLRLAANTRAQIILYRHHRTAHLFTGEILFEIRAHADRPFDVYTPSTRLRVLGTTFSVAVRQGQVRAAVSEGEVAVSALSDGRPLPSSGHITRGPGKDDPPGLILRAGHAIEAHPDGLGAVKRVDIHTVGDWIQGRLHFDDTALPDALARWNDYLPQPMRMAATSGLDTLRLSGSYPLHDPGAFLDALPRMLPVTVQRKGDGTILIQARRP